MKKVGIITFHCQYNCGSALQAFSLQTTIEHMGYSAQIINYFFTDDMKVYGIRWGSTFSVVLLDALLTPKRLLQHRNFKKFHKKYFKLTPFTKKEDEIKKISKGFDILVSGSDQIWNSSLGSIDYPYFLMFANDSQKKVAYAPSINKDDIESSRRAELYRLLIDYHSLSTREDKTAHILSELLNRKVECVLDPVLLHNAEFFDQIIANESIGFPSNYIFVYNLSLVRSESLFRFAEKYANNNGCKIVYYSKVTHFGSNYSKNIFTKGPLAFIKAIREARFIVSDSFHACAFSIIYSKPFASNHDNIRINELINKLGIKNIFISDGNVDIESIDYDLVHKRLFEYKTKSIEWLKRALENEKQN